MNERGTEQHIRRPGTSYRAEDYDDEGNLKAPVWLWAGVRGFCCPGGLRQQG
ncbi:TPA: DUF2919 domain-containing protein [Salmonella enterica]|uniref:DUF2919 domain-containing protein n=1 Tax=Salmonella enterica TaxID=28901 RepID=A0A759MD18_SALER|nr:DUF2919 domain-containing protein [Salmonella enterica]